jgi:hypothetical protein
VRGGENTTGRIMHPPCRVAAKGTGIKSLLTEEHRESVPARSVDRELRLENTRS